MRVCVLSNQRNWDRNAELPASQVPPVPCPWLAWRLSLYPLSPFGNRTLNVSPRASQQGIACRRGSTQLS